VTSNVAFIGWWLHSLVFALVYHDSEMCQAVCTV